MAVGVGLRALRSGYSGGSGAEGQVRPGGAILGGEGL